jgi:hypothetical protein
LKLPVLSLGRETPPASRIPSACTPRGVISHRLYPGWLSLRHIQVFHIEQIGKDSKELEELAAALIDSPYQLHTTYTDLRRDLWKRLWLPVLLDVSRAALKSRTRMSDSAPAEILAGRSRPHPRNAKSLKRVAARHARAQLEAWKLAVPKHQLGRLHAYLENRSEHLATPLCPVCGTLVPKPSATYCGRAYKQKGYRRRVAPMSPSEPPRRAGRTAPR